MTVYDAAKTIAANGMQQAQVFDFFTRMDSRSGGSVLQHVALFGQFGIEQRKVWDMYEDWQNDGTDGPGKYYLWASWDQPEKRTTYDTYQRARKACQLENETCPEVLAGNSPYIVRW